MFEVRSVVHFSDNLEGRLSTGGDKLVSRKMPRLNGGGCRINKPERCLPARWSKRYPFGTFPLNALETKACPTTFFSIIRLETRKKKNTQVSSAWLTTRIKKNTLPEKSGAQRTVFHETYMKWCSSHTVAHFAPFALCKPDRVRQLRSEGCVSRERPINYYSRMCPSRFSYRRRC